MKATSSLVLAQKGDRHAIATLINKHFYKLGLSASAEQSRRGLTITVEHDHQPPDAQWTTDFVYRLLSKVRPAGVQRIWLQGRVTGQRRAWRQQLQLDVSRPRQPYRPYRRRDFSTPLAMVSILTLSVAGLWHSYRAQTQPWEYQLERVDASLLEATLTHYGTQGWELTAAPKAIPTQDDAAAPAYEVVFKRQAPLESSAASAAATGIPPLALGTVTDKTQFQTLNDQGQAVVSTASQPAVGSQFEADQTPSVPPPLPVPALP
ncbi:MAG: hypothetical protein AAFU71_02525 [Cyanobacteria bacterium J06632_22]